MGFTMTLFPLKYDVTCASRLPASGRNAKVCIWRVGGLRFERNRGHYMVVRA